jgi:hypothetical protein
LQRVNVAGELPAAVPALTREHIAVLDGRRLGWEWSF